MCPGSLVERGRACGAVLVPQSGRARHVVIRHHRRLHGLQGFVGGVTPGVRPAKVKERERESRFQPQYVEKEKCSQSKQKGG